MAMKCDLETWVFDALKALGGSAKLVDVSKKIWEMHKGELEVSGPLFYTWQYDTRWAANQLRRKGLMKNADLSPKGTWELQGPR
jgi:hypothetical protein